MARKGLASARSLSSCLHLASYSHSVSATFYGAGPALPFQKDGGRKLKPITCQCLWWRVLDKQGAQAHGVTKQER